MVESAVGVGGIDGMKLEVRWREKRNEVDPAEEERELVEREGTRGDGGVEKRRGKEMIGCGLEELEGN